VLERGTVKQYLPHQNLPCQLAAHRVARLKKGLQVAVGMGVVPLSWILLIHYRGGPLAIALSFAYVLAGFFVIHVIVRTRMWQLSLTKEDLRELGRTPATRTTDRVIQHGPEESEIADAAARASNCIDEGRLDAALALYDAITTKYPAHPACADIRNARDRLSARLARAGAEDAATRGQRVPNRE
jgi:hypothetical protein